MRCVSCNAELPENSTYCLYCSTSIQPQIEQEPVVQPRVRVPVFRSIREGTRAFLQDFWKYALIVAVLSLARYLFSFVPVSISFTGPWSFAFAGGATKMDVNINPFSVLGLGFFVMAFNRLKGGTPHVLDYLNALRFLGRLILFLIFMFLTIWAIAFIGAIFRSSLLIVIPMYAVFTLWTMVPPLIIDQRLGIWAAMKASQQCVRKKWYAFVGFYLLLVLLPIPLALPAALLGDPGIMVSLILPWSVCCQAALYLAVYKGGPSGTIRSEHRVDLNA